MLYWAAVFFSSLLCSQAYSRIFGIAAAAARSREDSLLRIPWCLTIVSLIAGRRPRAVVTTRRRLARRLFISRRRRNLESGVAVRLFGFLAPARARAASLGSMSSRRTASSNASCENSPPLSEMTLLPVAIS